MTTPITFNNIDPSNIHVRKLKEFVKNNFTWPPKDFFKDIIVSMELILASEKIDLLETFQPINVKGKEMSKEDRFERLKKYNSIKIVNGTLLIDDLTIPILDILRDYKASLSTPAKLTNTRSFDYKDVIEEDEDDLVTPKPITDISSVRLNLFYNKDIKYNYTHFEPVHQIDPSHSNLQNVRLVINGMLEKNYIIVKRKVICTHKEKGVECGNVVYFSDVHLNSTIKCTDSLPFTTNKGHIIKNTSKAVTENTKALYVYEGRDATTAIDGSGTSEEVIIASLVPLDHNYVTCNCLYVKEDESSYILVLSVKDEEVKELDEPILSHSSSSLYFLSDIYKSIQLYLDKYHNIKLTSQNQVVGHYIIFQALINIFYNKRTNSMVVGKSGSGKSVWSEFLLPLFTLKYKNILGTDVTRNRFIGGKSNMNSSAVNSLFAAGYIATQDLIFAEECTNALKEFQEGMQNQNNNIFHLLKSCSGNDVEVAIQGGEKVYPKASTILVGNLEQLDFTQEYRKLVASKYRKLKTEGVKEYKTMWPLFKPIEYYVDVLKDRTLAEAHAIVRQTYSNISGRHFITRLPVAEMARYAFFIAIEDDLNAKPKKRELKKATRLFNPKRDVFVKELAAIFNKDVPDTMKVIINDFYNDEFSESRHNFKTIFGIEEMNINAHIENNIVMIMEYLVWMDRLYKNYFSNNPTSIKVLETQPLTDGERNLIYYFLSFNFNTLSSKEASMVARPMINDFEALKDRSSINIDLESKEEYARKKREEKEREERDMKVFLDDNDEGENIL